MDQPLNLEREVGRFRRDPLDPLLEIVSDHGSLFVHGDTGRYYRAYDFYALSLQRALHHVSVGRRFQAEVRYYYGGQRRFSDRQKGISHTYRQQRPFFELDFTNYLIHARILLDRTIGLSRRFLTGSRLPSFTSFSDHKKFLKKHPRSLGNRHRAYSQYIVERTDWFEMPLKDIRDKFMVHTPPQHFLMMGYPSRHDLDMIFMPVQRDDSDRFTRSTPLKFSVRRLARDIEEFLAWYNGYALAALRSDRVRKNRSR